MSSHAPALNQTTLDAVLRRNLSVLDRADLRRETHPVRERRGAAVSDSGRPVIDFSSNDYLGLAGDQRIADAIATALRREGTGAAAARLISGTNDLHEELEAALAAFKGTEAALLFSSGYAANTGAIPALASRGDVIYADALNHASLIDGCRLSRAEVKIFPHLDLDRLDDMLRDDAEHDGCRWIVVDAVFSMDGDAFPLDALVTLAHEHRAFTYVDDAHGTGLLGANGRGSAERWNVEHRIDVNMATLGKAIGTSGAFIAGSQLLRDWLLNRARAFVFTTAAPPALAAGTIEALRIVQAEPWRREQLRGNARALRDGLRTLGCDPAGDDDGHIIPLIIGEAAATARVGGALRERGLLVGAVRPPTVPLGSSRLRITASAAHTPEQIAHLLDALRDVLPRRAS
ncbi:MAG TPA: 8-amino-7-oxononanoate synthase [Gemmatimonadaceae bacterium]|nr:8-amino-7-oxononanoate synthase [Gemmatimonadaceae bacterium]